NTMLGEELYVMASSAGAHRENGADIIVLVFYFILSIFNVIFSAVLVAFQGHVINGNEAAQQYFYTSIRSSPVEAFAVEIGISELMYNTLWPATLLLPYIGFAFGGYLVKFAFMYIRAKRSSSLTPATAEALLEPSAMWLAWDYSLIVANCLTCVLFLFTVAPLNVAPSIFVNMIMWCGFMYISQKTLHLRMSKVRIYYSHRLDLCALVLWSIVIGAIGSVPVYWKGRADRATMGSVVIIFLVVAGSYLVCLLVIFNTSYCKADESFECDVTFDEAQDNLLFDWFNCNPIHVLKSQFGLLSKPTGDATNFLARGPRVLYRQGKQHLQIADFAERRRRLIETLMNSDILEASSGKQRVSIDEKYVVSAGESLWIKATKFAKSNDEAARIAFSPRSPPRGSWGSLLFSDGVPGPAVCGPERPTAQGLSPRQYESDYPITSLRTSSGAFLLHHRSLHLLIIATANTASPERHSAHRNELGALRALSTRTADSADLVLPYDTSDMRSLPRTGPVQRGPGNDLLDEKVTLINSVPVAEKWLRAPCLRRKGD
ncbi:hypothetical protein FOL47_008846, partial [Perkinsus chesapeaki]